MGCVVSSQEKTGLVGVTQMEPVPVLYCGVVMLIAHETLIGIPVALGRMAGVGATV